MKLFKYISLLITLSIVFVLSSNHVFSAVIPGPGIEIKNQTEFTDLSFEDRVYKPGDVVKASFTFVNNDSYDYTDVSLSPYLMVFSSTTKTFNVYGMQNKIGSYFIPRSSKKTISFEYTIPQSGNIEKSSIVRLVANVFQGTGVSLGPVSSPVKIDDLVSSIDVTSVYLKVNNHSYGIQAGPVVSATTSVYLVATLKNTTGNSVSLNPKLTIFDLQPSRPEVSNKSYNVLVLKNGESREVDFEVPQLSKPGVYAGELRMFDEKGIERSTLITSRWIIDGDMVTIPSVTIDRTSLNKGEQANVNVVYTGAPININTGTKYSVGKGDIEVTLYGDKNQVIASDKKEVDFDTLSSNATFNLVAKDESSKISVVAVASKEGKELARYGTLLTNPDTYIATKSPLKNIIIIFSLIFVLALLLVFVLFRMRSKKAMSTLFFILTFSALCGLGGKEAQAADRACLNNQFCAQGSMTSNLVVYPNKDISSDIWNVAEAQVCSNWPGNTRITYQIYDSNNNLISEKKAEQDDAILYGHGDPRSANLWRVFSGFYPNTANHISVNIIAPLAPGIYTLKESVWLDANYRDAWRAINDPINGGKTTQGPIQFQYNFIVSCPSGEVWNGSSCSSGNVQGGSCGIYAGSCLSGSPSNLSTTTTSNTWLCSTNSGTTSSCSACLSGFHLGGTSECVKNIVAGCVDDGSRHCINNNLVDNCGTTIRTNCTVCVPSAINSCSGNNLIDSCGNVVKTLNSTQTFASDSNGCRIVNKKDLMKINSFLSSPSYIAKNSSCALKYDISNGSSTCSISGYGSNFPYTINLTNGSASGTVSTPNLTSSATYKLNCGFDDVTLVKAAICRVLGVSEF